jgi:hypothetical protein
LWNLHTCTLFTLFKFIPTIILPHPHPHYQNDFESLKCSFFIQVYKMYQLYPPSFVLFIHPLPPTSYHLWTGHILHSCSSLFMCISHSKDSHHGISFVNMLCFNQINQLYYTLQYPVPHQLLFNNFQFCLFPT